jgi:MFS family permease
MTYTITARISYGELHGYNVTVPCNHPNSLSWSSYRFWMAIPSFLQTISIAMVSTSGIEFLASQSPYSMRGLMVGASYGSMFIFTMIGYGIYWPFTHQSSNWGIAVISCEFWYLLLLLLVMIIFSCLLLVAGRWYKNRKREDVLPNEHIFAERYYEHKVQAKHDKR